MKLSIIIPAFNEEYCILSTLKDVLFFLEKKDFEYEVIVVNDGSADKTVSIVNQISHPALRLISHTKNKGKGAAVKTGVSNSNGDLILFMDADNSTNISEISKFLPKISQNNIIIGSRALKKSQIVVHQPVWKELFGKLGNELIKIITGLKINDTQCGFKLFDAKAVQLFKELNNQGWAFDVELLLRAKKKGLKVLEYPIVWKNDSHSKFSLNCYPKFFFELIKIRLNI